MDCTMAAAAVGAYLGELGKVKEAQEALNAAIALSPMNSQYHSELAYTYQLLKDCDKSIATYEQAASMAEWGSEETTKTADLTRAWQSVSSYSVTIIIE